MQHFKALQRPLRVFSDARRCGAGKGPAGAWGCPQPAEFETEEEGTMHFSHRDQIFPDARFLRECAW